MRAAARQAPHRQPADPEGLADHPDIADAIGHGPSRLRRRAAVTRPVVADQPQPAALRISHRARAVQAAASWRANVDHHRAAATIPGVLDSQRPAIWCLHEPLHIRASSSTCMIRPANYANVQPARWLTVTATMGR